MSRKPLSKRNREKSKLRKEVKNMEQALLAMELLTKLTQCFGDFDREFYKLLVALRFAYPIPPESKSH